MRNFFCDDEFCTDLGDLISLFDIDEDNVNDLSDDWKVQVELTDLEPIFEVNADILCELLADASEDRLTEDGDEEEDILKALRECIDLEKLQTTLPKLHYPNGKNSVLTKLDLIEWFSQK